MNNYASNTTKMMYECMNTERKKGKHNTTQFLPETTKLIYGREIIPYEETQIKCKLLVKILIIRRILVCILLGPLGILSG